MVEQRYVVCGMMIFLFTVSLGSRASFSIVLTRMVFIPNLNQTTASNHENISPANAIQETFQKNETSTMLNINDDRFGWSQQLQGIILSSLSWGYLVAMIPSGLFAQKYGAKVMLLTGFFLSGIINFLTPMAVAYGDVHGLILARALTGLLQAPMYPCSDIFSIAWFPIEQRGRFSALISAGNGIGGFFALYFSGILIDHFGRWDVAFYFHGTITLVWCILFFFLCYERPQDHPFISEEESIFLASKIDYLQKKDSLKTPWCIILTSGPIIALCIAKSFGSWTNTVTQYSLPKYMNDVLHMPIKRNAFYSSLPKTFNVFISLFAGFLTDWMLVKRNISLTKIRKIFVALSSLSAGIFLVAASYAECDELQGAIYLILATSFYELNIVGLDPNILDLAPNYVGPITGLLNSFATVTAIISNYAIGVLTPHAYLSEWRLVLWMAFSFCAGQTIIFTFWGSAKIQPWNASEKNEPNGSKSFKENSPLAH